MKKLTLIGITLTLLLGLALWRQQRSVAAKAAPVFVTHTVTTTADSGSGSLRDAIAAASPGDTIDFSLSGCPCTITLTSGELVVNKSLTIDGPGASQLTISGNNTSRVFYITLGTVTLDGLAVSGGNGVGAFSGSGGGIRNDFNAVLMLTNSIVSGNSANFAGGIFNNVGTLTVTNSAVSGNNSTNGSGGGIANTIGTVTVTNSSVYGNSASGGGDGGGISNGDGALILNNSTVSGNSASNGGGILNGGDGTITLTNSTVTGNNVSGTGGGIFARSAETLNNTIVAGNFVGTTANDIGSGTINTANNNLIGDAASSGGIANGVNGNKVGNSGVGAIDINTVLDTTLANNGGPTLTHALIPGSPAHNAGSNALALDAANQPLTTDQRGAGFPRTIGGTVDIGAFEVQVNAPCPAGKYDNGSGCVDADPGYYVPTAGATAQIACAEGTYQPNSGAVSCIDAAAGNYVDTTAAVAQIQCAVGTYQPDTGSSSCIAASVGNYVASTGATAQTACAAGSYQPNSGATSCFLASAGNFVATSGAAAQTSCPLGTYQPNIGATSCTSASAGHFVNQSGSIAQTACQPGYYQPNTGAISCIAASAGYYVPVAASIAQLACPTGYTSPPAAIACTLPTYNFTGFFQPIDNAPTVNTVTAGQAIPVKFSLGGYQGMSIFATGYPVSQPIACSSSSPTDPIEETVTAGGSSLSYDATTDQYKYVWKTDKAWKGQCRKLILKFSDGTEKYALFKFR